MKNEEETEFFFKKGSEGDLEVIKGNTYAWRQRLVSLGPSTVGI